MKVLHIRNFRKGLATNSSSTHSLVYKNKDELFKDLNVMEYNFYGRCMNTIASTKKAKIKYVLANIMYNEPLVKIMTSFYPEMRKYFIKIKDTFEENWDKLGDTDGFGMYFRGCLYFPNNLEASVDYLRHIIDDPEIVIVGGSDEMDFVYDTVKDHELVPDPENLDCRPYNGVTKNGNYWFGYGDGYRYCDTEDIRHASMGKVRFSVNKEDTIVPEYPELIDLKITNMCNHGCKFCYMGADGNGKHADLNFLRNIIFSLGHKNEYGFHRVEFSIGGGNVLLYPQLGELFKFISERGHIINVTIKADDVDTLMNDEKLSDIFKKYVSGIGVSVLSVDDVEKVQELEVYFNKDNNWIERKYIVAHMIPEYLGVEKSIEMLKICKDHWMNVLFLGFKSIGRGSSCGYNELTKDDLIRLFSDRPSVSIDTTFANRYMWYIKDNFEHKSTITTLEGEFSMYIDGVEEKAYKSSYQLDKPYNMHIDWASKGSNPFYNIKEAFTEIRKDNGLAIYDDIKDHYYYDAKHYL